MVSLVKINSDTAAVKFYLIHLEPIDVINSYFISTDFNDFNN